MVRTIVLTLSVALLVIGAITLSTGRGPTAATATKGSQLMGKESRKDTVMTDKTNKSETDLKAKLTPEQYRVTQQCGTEPAFSGKYYKHHEDGMYHCVVCDNPLFTSDTKYESGSGWPSFFAPASKNAVVSKTDRSHGMERTEITCGKCGAHLGHVFDDGPNPTGLRYCINSAALDFEKDLSAKKTPSSDTDSSK